MQDGAADADVAASDGASSLDGGGDAGDAGARDSGETDTGFSCGLGTWDTTYEFAVGICGNRDCEVCVQEVFADGGASLWVALENASRCDCTPPTVKRP
jgi:hypothetical protein